MDGGSLYKAVLYYPNCYYSHLENLAGRKSKRPKYLLNETRSRILHKYNANYTKCKFCIIEGSKKHDLRLNRNLPHRKFQPEILYPSSRNLLIQYAHVPIRTRLNLLSRALSNHSSFINSRMKYGKSSGRRDVTSLRSTTTGAFSYSAPALTRSSRMPG